MHLFDIGDLLVFSFYIPIVYCREWEGLCGKECVHSRHKYLLWGIPLQQWELQQFFMAVTSFLFAGSPAKAFHGRRGGWARLSCGGTTWEGQETKKGLLLYIAKGTWPAYKYDFSFSTFRFLNIRKLNEDFYVQQQLSVKEFYLKIIPWRLFTFRVCPGTKVSRADVRKPWKQLLPFGSTTSL